ncbi:MAG: aminotransferase class V-fold PLP-dependent enzyme [Candidatus Eremiobacteraeota bacterium]|nr:aminotransferase class V-fold PLP-dependent enzyme [Candidatus Eremiobacteraeota bacterium]
MLETTKSPAAQGRGGSPARLRERFPTLASATYLVSHSMGAPPVGARDALTRYWDEWAQDGPEAWDRWLPEIAALADNLGRIFGAAPGTVSLCPNVSLAMAAIASTFDYRPERAQVVIEALQFPTVLYVWKAWERYGARVQVVASDDGRTMSTDRLCSAIGEQTAAVVLSHAAYVSGAVIDVPAIVARCRETGSLFVLDAYQTTGVIPYDVNALGVDVVVGGSHKWLCGGPGCGFIYVRPELRERLGPAVTGWMGHAEPFAFEDAPIRLAPRAHRYNTGTPTIPGYLAARAGHDAILEVGVAAVREHNIALTNELVEGALARDFTVPTPLDPAWRTGWIGMDFPGAEKVSDALIAERVFVDYRPGCGIRVGPHFYTTSDEIANFFRVVDAVRA